MALLIFGQNGQLSRALRRSCVARGTEFQTVSSQELDLAQDPQGVRKYIKSGISGVMNASGYTQVDKAESETDQARRINAEAPKYMAQACKEIDVPFIHISTDYVFNGQGNRPYKTNDPVAPINVYGESKRAGEEAVLTTGGRSAILRTSWVYDGQGKNFLTTMLRLAQSREHINVVCDQIGRPTYAGHLAESALEMLGHMPTQAEIFHVTNSGEPISWADFARAIFERSGLDVAVGSIATKDYPTPAKRPAYSVLEISKFEQHVGHRLLPWQAGLEAALKETTL